MSTFAIVAVILVPTLAGGAAFWTVAQRHEGMERRKYLTGGTVLVACGSIAAAVTGWLSTVAPRD